MPTIATTVHARIDVAREPLFACFVPIELPRILRRHGPIPAVVGTRDQTGPWDEVGSARVVELADGHTASERVTACETPARFAYTVSGFTNVVRHLAREAHGEWVFEEADGGRATDVRWTYAFVARSGPAALLLAPVVRTAWRGYMRGALDRFAAIAADEVAV